MKHHNTLYSQDMLHQTRGNDNSLRPLKIGIVLSKFEKSGVTSNTVDLCEGLKKLGHDVTLIVGRPKQDFQKLRSKYLESMGVNQIFISNISESVVSRLATFFNLCKVLLSQKFDILHFESIYLTFIPRLLHKKFVLTYHSFGLKNNIFSQHATRLISISKGITDDAINRHGYKRNEIDIVLHGVSKRFAQAYDDKTRQKIRNELGIPSDKLIIGIVASIEPRKGHHFLLEAISQLNIEKREKLHIVFCGNFKGDDSEDWLNEQIRRFDLEKRVTVLEFQDPLKIYQSLDIFCLPSVWEGFPLTAVEAMLARCCVIRSNVQGAQEQIIEGVTGYTFESENPRALNAVIDKLMDNPDVIKTTAARAKEYALNHFTLDKMALNTSLAYYKVLSE